MRLRTIDGAYTELLAADPASALTKTGLRRLIASGELPARKVGAKVLIDLDTIETYFAVQTADAAPELPECEQVGMIRRIEL